MDKKTASKLTSTKTPAISRKPSSKPLSKKTGISQEQIALRAYFISERRQQLGSEGDPLTDWIDAEEQLMSEAKLRA